MSGKLKHRSDQRRMNEAAAAWLLTLQDDYTNESEADFRQWLETSADHIQAFLEVTAADRDLDGMDAGRRMDLDTLMREAREEGATAIVALEEKEGLRLTPAPFPPLRRRGGKKKWIGMAAAAGIAAVGGLLLWAGLAPSRYTTAVGEQRAVKLADGSLVYLNTRSRIAVTFKQNSREVRLIEGEALFAVERDTARPFRVITGGAVIQVLGTQFNVYRRTEGSTVSVVDGRVKVSGLELAAGEEAYAGNSGRVVKHPGANIAKAIAWRQRELDFDHAPLAYVVEQFNRYNEVQIRIADAEVRSRELEGVFKADQPEALLAFLGQERNLRIERRGSVIVIGGRKD